MSWTPSEEAWLIENASNTTTQEAALHLGRTAEAVRKKAQHLGVSLLWSSGWTKDEDDYLRNYFDRKSIKAIAKHLDRGYHGVRRRMIALGLGTKLDQIDHRITAQEIALRLGVDVDASREWMREQRFPCELVGKWLVTDEEAVNKWLRLATSCAPIGRRWITATACCMTASCQSTTRRRISARSMCLHCRP